LIIGQSGQCAPGGYYNQQSVTHPKRRPIDDDDVVPPVINEIAAEFKEGFMGKKLDGKKVAILVADGFEQVELTEPKSALEAEGATTESSHPQKAKLQGWNHDEKADAFRVEMPLELARSDDYDALLLPGGVRNPDQLRQLTRALEFVDGFFATGKPVAAICHASWTLIEAGVVEGRKITSWPSLKTDLRNAGANWVDRDVVVDKGLVSSRKPADIPAFNKKMVEEFAEGRRASQRAALRVVK
jgi:protease I